MIPDGFQYFLDDFWNFQYFHQTCPLTPLFLCRNASNNPRNLWKHLKNIIFISHHFKIPIFPKNDTTGHQKCGTTFLVDFLSGGSKTFGFSERFQRFVGGGILMNFGNLKITKKRNISESY